MTQDTRCKELYGHIERELAPLIGEKCILLGVPHYLNIGDVLIWEGTRKFLDSIGVKCIYTASKESYRFKKIDRCVTVLLQGGGNFGDLWPEEHKFRVRIIQEYPDNRIIILPQTVYYQDDKTRDADKVLFAGHRDLYICVRDNKSYETISGIINPGRLKLVPDMAFAITPEKSNAAGKINLLINRTDKEFRELPTCLQIPENTLICDWPSMDPERITFNSRLFRFMFKQLKRIPVLSDAMAIFFFRPYMIRLGKAFLSPFSHVYTTRLHGCILSMLLSKPVTLLDNSYKKNSCFFYTWLKDVDNTNMNL